MDKATNAQITDRIKAIALDLSPTITFRSMYGGTVMELKKGDPKTRIGGIFSYDAHVSLEFARGVSITDPAGVLQGTGKHRRHIKLHSLNDLEAIDCASLLSQAISLA